MTQNSSWRFYFLITEGEVWEENKFGIQIETRSGDKKKVRSGKKAQIVKLYCEEDVTKIVEKIFNRDQSRIAL